MDNKEKIQLKKICDKNGDRMDFDFSMRNCSTIDIGGDAAMYRPATLRGLKEVKMFLLENGLDSKIVGKGSNMLIPDSGIDDIMINLSSEDFRGCDFRDATLSAGGGAYLGEVVFECCRKGLGGMEGLAGIPGTVGGALKMNASYKCAISEFLEKILILNENGTLKWIDRNEMSFDYRNSFLKGGDIIVRAEFALKRMSPNTLKKALKSLIEEKTDKQPLDKRTLGCVFKNPQDGTLTAGELLDKAELKGYRIGGAEVSEKHANFIVNNGGARSLDVVLLVDEMKKRVRDSFDIHLEPEICIL